MKLTLSEKEKEIYSYYTDKNKYVPDSTRHIAQKVGCHPSYVDKVKRELVLRGWLDPKTFLPKEQV
jgi:hypothetical protein